MKTSLLLAAIFSVMVLNVHSQNVIRRVDANTANGAPYSTIQAAIDAAVANDTIQIAGASSGYAGATVTKPLVFIGPGYFLGENPETQVNKSPARIIGTLAFDAGSSNSVVMGLFFDSPGAIHIDGGLGNIIIKRNYFDNSPGITFNATNAVINTVSIQQNYFATRPVDNSFNVTNNNVSLLNNFIGGDISGLSGSGMTIKNNVIVSTSNFAFNASDPVMNSTVQNNIIIITGTTPAANMDVSNSFTNNLSNVAVFGTANSNQASVNMTTVFQVDPALVTPPAPFSTDGRWQLVPTTSPAIGAGAASEDCGMFGTTDPYILSGIPPIPAIYEIAAPSSATQSGGLNVNIKAKSRP